jgi:hypothetical protein
LAVPKEQIAALPEVGKLGGNMITGYRRDVMLDKVTLKDAIIIKEKSIIIIVFMLSINNGNIGSGQLSLKPGWAPCTTLLAAARDGPATL